MFVDASAIVAILATEPDAPLFVAELERGNGRTSPMAVWESVVSLSRRLNVDPHFASELVSDLLAGAPVDIVAVPPEAADLAVEAFARFGKGRHPAGLNFGDCFSYACARHLRVPLLYKGRDFPSTDIASALPVD